jgi:hypothetical protein
LDVVVSGGAAGSSAWLVNNGSGVFSSSGGLSVGPGFGTVVAVDVDGDGDVDVPGIGFVNTAVTSGGVAAGAVVVRVLSRAGTRSCHGAAIIVRRSADGAVVLSRVVSGGDAPYDVLMSMSPLMGSSFDVEVVFPSGFRHSKVTQAALGNVPLSTAASVAVPLVVVMDTPVLASLRLLPASGIVGVGRNITVLVDATRGEADLVANVGGCVVNGVDVSGTLQSFGNGTYSVTYTVVESVAGVTAADVSMTLADRASRANSNTLTSRSGLVFVDSRSPYVSFNATSDCSPGNGTVTAAANQSLCVSCGTLLSEPLGCQVFIRFNASQPVVNLTTDASNSVNVTLGPYVHGSVAVVTAWAVDRAGNVGPVSALTWEVDLRSPVTLWTPRDPPSFTNSTAILFSFGCTEAVSGVETVRAQCIAVVSCCLRTTRSCRLRCVCMLSVYHFPEL